MKLRTTPGTIWWVLALAGCTGGPVSDFPFLDEDDRTPGPAGTAGGGGAEATDTPAQSGDGLDGGAPEGCGDESPGDAAVPCDGAECDAAADCEAGTDCDAGVDAGAPEPCTQTGSTGSR